MTTLDQIQDKVEQLRGELAVAIAAQKLSPKQITIVNGLSDINNSLGIVRAGQFFALSDGEDPQDSNGTGTFISAAGRTFGSKQYHIGGVKDGDLKWGANSQTGELEAGDGAVVLSKDGISLYDGTTEVGRLGNLNGFLSYSSDTFGIGMGDSDQYMTYDQDNGLRVYGALVSGREILTADRTYYVATTGSDSNDGLTAGAPFLTIQKAIDTIADTLDVRGFDTTIQLADGTYETTESIFLRGLIGTGEVNIIGNETTWSNVIISSSAITAIDADFVVTRYNLKGFKIISDGAGLYVKHGSYVSIEKLDFGACGGSHMNSSWRGTIEIIDDYNISGGANYHFRALEYGYIIYDGSSVTITLTNTPAFVSAFAASGILAAIYAPYITFSGSATGVRYLSTFNAYIGTNNAGANYFPGDSAGSTATGGLYD